MQLQIYNNNYRAIFIDELVRFRKRYEEKLTEVEEQYFKRYKTSKEAIINFILDQKDLINSDEILLREEHQLNMELKRQDDFLNSPPQYKEEYKYISDTGECLAVYQRLTESEEEIQERAKKEEREGYFFALPPDPAFEEERVLLN